VSFKVIEEKTTFLLKNINNIIGAITGLIAAFTLCKLLLN
jgi:hypothetical protein